MDVERTIEFILQQQAKAEVRAERRDARTERHEARMERLEARAALAKPKPNAR
jgi:hypothetical protein